MHIFLQVQPPSSGDDNTVLLWVVGTLVLAVGGLFATYQKAISDVKKAHELRIRDRDDIILGLKEGLALERSDNKALRSEREKFLMEIKKSLDDQNTVTGKVDSSMNEIKQLFLKLLSK